MPKTGDSANITAYVSKDYGAVTVLTDTTATEMDATNAPGYYLFDAAQGETNADCLLVSAKSSTANIKVLGAPAVIYTRPTTGWLAPTTAGRTLDVSAGGEAGVDWANIGSSSTGVDLIWAKACTEPTAVVGASPTSIAAVSWLLTQSRNKITQTATSQIIKADDGATTIATSTVSDDGTTFTRGEFA